MDMNAATAPGRAYGQMFANLGKIAGDSIEKYAEGKKKKEEQKQTASFIKRALMNSPETAAQFGITATDSVTFEEAVDQSSNAIAKDPKGLETVKGFVEMANERLKAQQETELFALRKKQYEDSAKDRKRLSKEAEELKESQLKLDRFLTQRPKTETTEFSNLQKQFTLDQIPGTPEFEAKELSEPMGARPPLMASVATDKPNFKMFNVGKSEAVARLPESFQPQGVRVIDAVESGRLTPREGMGLINQIQAQAMAEQKAGPTRSEILAREKYEDEKATRESEKEILDTESTNNLTDFYNETSGLLDKINEKTVDVTGPIEGTSVYRFFSKIGDTDDEQVRRRLEMFTRKLTLDAAQNLKGALSDKDIRFLVEQAPDMDDNPSVWKKYMGDLKTRLERNATQKGINFEDTNSPQQSANTIDPADLENAIQAKRKQLEQRTMMQQTLDNPNVPNYGPQ